MSEEYFLNYNGEKIFVILLGYSGNKYYLYYPKGDVLVIVDDRGNIEMKEILDIVGELPSGFKVANLTIPWEEVKNRKVIWNVYNSEVESDNIYVVTSSPKEYKLIEQTSAPDRLKSFAFRDVDPWDYKDWCCVLIVSTKDVKEMPKSFKKLYFENGKIIEKKG